ncbi:MAG: flagellar protein FlaG [Bacillaceae bacterium]|nr:flagellar protein FlaG [Bacillaceae bacterium]
MQIHVTNKIFRPIISAPEHNYDQYKTPSVQRAEREANVSNPQVKQIVRQSLQEVYRNFQKLVENTDYNVSYVLNEHGAGKQYRITMKNSGKEVVSFPPRAAVDIANRAKHTTIGLLMDKSV